MKDITHQKKIVFLIVLLLLACFLMRDQVLGQEEQHRNHIWR